ncbi:transcriptional regulator, TetR family [Lachnospiraceae bacterium]|nr:transcriptional regulator, TetR family [Lachnospiraceae bacterium]
MRMSEVKMDRRIRKTKSLLWHGLATLMMEQDIQDISVKKLTEFVDLNRSTFYIHYKDINQLLESIENELMEEFREIISHNLDISNLYESNLQLLHELYKDLLLNREIISALLGPHGDFQFIKKLKNILTERIEEVGKSFNYSEEVLSYYSAFCFTGCVGIIQNWIDTGFEQTPEHIADITNRFMVQGVGSILR